MTEALATEQAPEAAPAVVDALTQTEVDDGLSEDEQMEAIWRKHAGKAEEAPPDTEPDEQRADEGDDQRPRDERGRFVSGDTEGGEEGQEPVEAAEGQEATEDAPTDALAAPSHLPAALREAWADMPETAREAITKQQADTDRKFAEQGRTLQAYKPVAERIIQAAQSIPSFKGMSPDQIAEGAVNLAHVQAKMNESPAETILEIAKTYGVDSQLRQHYASDGYEPGDPAREGQTAVANLEQEVARLNRQLQEANNPDRLSQTVEQMLDQREINRSVQEFASSNALYAVVEPHLPRFIEQVRTEQPSLAPQATLQAAYQKAVSSFGLATAQANATTEQKPAVTSPADRTRTDAAKRAAAVNLRGRDGAKPREQTEDEALEAVARKHGLT